LAHLQSIDRTKTSRRRSGRLNLRWDSEPLYSPKSSGLRYLGNVDGYAMDMSFVANDPYVHDVIKQSYGEIPKELRGMTRSGATMERLFSGLARYDHEYKRPVNDHLFTEACRITMAAFKLPKAVKPYKLESVRVELDASAGWSYLGLKKKEVYAEALCEADKLTRLARNGRLSKKSVPPCVAFKRTQLARVTEPKVRVVWGFPFEITLVEGQYAQPLIDAYAQMDSPMFIGRTVLKELPLFMDGVFLHGQRGCALDWSGFDSSLSPWLIRFAFDVMAANLDMSDGAKSELQFIEDYFINTPIVMPNGNVFVKKGGVPSGSFFTQLVDSICNFLVIVYLQLRHWEGRWSKTKVLGDDSVFSVAEGNLIDLAAWALVAQMEFGMTLNARKSSVVSSPGELEFLGHSARAGKVKRDTTKLLQLALYPEYRVGGSDVSVSRVMGLLIDSGFNSFELFMLYTLMVGKYKTSAALRDKFMRYVIRQEIPGGLLSDARLWALS